MSYKESDSTAKHIENESVEPNSDFDTNSSSLKTGTNSYSIDSVPNNDSIVLNNRQVPCDEVLRNESCEGANAKVVENGLNNAELQSTSKNRINDCSYTLGDKENSGDSQQVCGNNCAEEDKTNVVQHTNVSNAQWACGSPGFSDTAVFTCRRDSSSDSVDSESSSSSSSSSSDWDSSSDTALVSDEDNTRRRPQAVPASRATPRRVAVPSAKTKGELTLDDLPPIEDLHISLPEHECKELGKVVSIIDKLVVVEPYRDLPTLNLDSVLFLDNGRRAMGHVFDVFGQVKEPLYCVRFNSADHIRESGVSVGTKVYCAPDTPYTNYVFVNQLLNLRGSDASWEQDNEPPASVVFYSDDEEEREARRKLRHEKSKLHVEEGTDSTPATQEPKPKRLSLMEERNNRRNLLLNATYSSTSSHGRRPARGRGWVAPSPDDYIIKPASFAFSTDWQPPCQDARQPESKPRFPPPSSPAASSPLFGMCRPPQFPFTSARFPMPPPLAANKNLFGILHAQAPEMLTFMQPPPSSQPPVRTFVGSGGVPFPTSHHRSGVPMGSARSPEAPAIRPASYGSTVAHVSFGPVQCPPSVLSPPPPFGISFNVMQRPPDLSTGPLGATGVRGPFGQQNRTSAVATRPREFPDAAVSKPMVFDPSQPPPKLPFNCSTTCGTFGSTNCPPAFSPVSRVVLSPAPNPATTVASCPRPSHASLPFNRAQRPLVPQQPSPPVFGTPWLQDPWRNPAASPRPAGVWQAPAAAPRLPGEMWRSRDVWQPRAPAWQVPGSSWQSVGVLSNPAWQSCDQTRGPSRPAGVPFDVSRLRSPPPRPPSSESSFYR